MSRIERAAHTVSINEGMIFCGKSTHTEHEVHACGHCENFVVLAYTRSTTAFLLIMTLLIKSFYYLKLLRNLGYSKCKSFAKSRNSSVAKYVNLKFEKLTCRENFMQSLKMVNFLYSVILTILTGF